MNKELEQSLSLLGLKPQAQKVLISLIELGNSPAAPIATKLSLPKSTVYDALEELVSNSLVVEFSGEQGKVFSIADAARLAELHQQRMKELQDAQTTFLHFMENHASETGTFKPKIKFYSGISGMRQAFRDMSWQKDIKTAYLMWPMQDMIDVLGEPFLEHHGSQRHKFGVHLKSIRKESDKRLNTAEHQWLIRHDPKEQARTVRYAPPSVDWSMSYWIYGDKCLFAGGDKERFAFTVHSREFASLMRLLWEQMWNISKE